MEQNIYETQRKRYAKESEERMTAIEKFQRDPIFNRMAKVIEQVLLETPLTVTDIKECIEVAEMLIKEKEEREKRK